MYVLEEGGTILSLNRYGDLWEAETIAIPWMQYQEYDLKADQTVISQEGQTITTIPGREDSLERLAELEVQFAAETESVEETVLRRLQYPGLHQVCLCVLFRGSAIL